MPEKKDIRTFIHWTLLPFLCVFLPSVGIVLCYRATVENERDGWLTLLLVIPLVAHLFICIYSFLKQSGARDISFIAVFCVLNVIAIYPYIGAWFVFINNTDPDVDFKVSMACLVMIGILVTTLILLSYLFLHPRGSLLRNYRLALKDNHFAGLMHFFSIFICMGFLAGFAMALHDRSTHYMDLYMENLQSKLAPEKPVRSVAERLGTCFYFPLPTKNSAGAMLMMNIKAPVLDDYGTSFSVQQKIEYENYLRLEEVVRYIKEVNESDQNKAALVRLIGKADEKNLQKGPYPTNLALSEARMTNVFSAIQEELLKTKKAIRLQWNRIPVSNDQEATLFTMPNFPGGRNTYCAAIGADATTNQRVVEIVVEPIINSSSPERGALVLMDYMYFSIYTITTTGYGDIKPVSAFSKWLCSIENIIEVFFLVIFVNLVIAFNSTTTADDITALIKKSG